MSDKHFGHARHDRQTTAIWLNKHERLLCLYASHMNQIVDVNNIVFFPLNLRTRTQATMTDNRSPNPVHHHSASLSGTSLQIPSTQRHQPSPLTSTDQSINSRTSTRQSYLSNSTSASNWTSVSALSANSSSIKPSLYPTSGYPLSGGIVANSYPGMGYPVSHLQHSYGYPSSNFPCCEVPGVMDLRSQLQYPGSEFPGGGMFPGEFEDDGSHPYIGALESGMYPSESGVYPSDPLVFSNGQGGFQPSGSSFLPTVDTMTMPGSFDPNYNAGYHPVWRDSILPQGSKTTAANTNVANTTDQTSVSKWYALLPCKTARWKHTIAPWPLERLCLRWFMAQWGDLKNLTLCLWMRLLLLLLLLLLIT